MGDLCQSIQEMLASAPEQLSDATLPQEWEAHIRGCRSCRREREASRRLLQLVGSTGQSLTLSRSAESFAQVALAQAHKAPPPRSWSSLVMLPLAACILVLVGLGSWQLAFAPAAPARNAPQARSEAISSKKPRPTQQILFVVERSYSMQPRRLKRAGQVLARVVEKLGPKSRLHVLHCAASCEALWPRWRAPSAALAQALKAQISGLQPRGATFFEQQLADIQRSLGPAPGARVLYFGDGYSAIGEHHPQRLAALLQRRLRGHRFSTVDLGGHTHQAMLYALSKAGQGRVYTYRSELSSLAEALLGSKAQDSSTMERRAHPPQPKAPYQGFWMGQGLFSPQELLRSARRPVARGVSAPIFASSGFPVPPLPVQDDLSASKSPKARPVPPPPPLSPNDELVPFFRKLAQKPKAQTKPKAFVLRRFESWDRKERKALATFERRATDRRNRWKLVRWALRLGQIAKARAALAAWRKRSPMDPQALIEEASLALLEGRPQAARLWLESALDIQPQHSAAHSRLIQLYRAKGDHKRVCSHARTRAFFAPKSWRFQVSAVRCSGRRGYLSRLSAADKKRALLALQSPPRRPRGGLRLEASWNLHAPLDLAVVSPHGEVFSWQGGGPRIQATDANHPLRESLRLGLPHPGRYRVYLIPPPKLKAHLRGTLRLSIAGQTRQLPFLIQGPLRPIAEVLKR